MGTLPWVLGLVSGSDRLYVTSLSHHRALFHLVFFKPELLCAGLCPLRQKRQGRHRVAQAFFFVHGQQTQHALCVGPLDLHVIYAST